MRTKDQRFTTNALKHSLIGQ